MAFTDKQIEWLETAQGKAADFAKGFEDAARKAAALSGILDKLEADKEDIRAAQQFKVTLARNSRIFILPGKGAMDWMTGNMKTEVDTYADISQAAKIDPEDVKDLHLAMEKILKRQQDMHDAGVFSDEDITRELWTPLVREGIIPSNIVPDRYNDFKHMFDGASAIYEDKLAEHSASASKCEAVFEGIGIDKDTISLAASIASAGITFGNLDVTGRSVEDTRNIQAKQEVLGAKQTSTVTDLRTTLKLPKETSDVEVLKAAASAGGHDAAIKEYNNLATARNALSDELFKDPRWVAEQRALLTASSGLLTAGLTVTEKAITFHEDQKKDTAKKLQFALQVADEIAANVVSSALSAAAPSDRQRSKDGNTSENRQAFAYASGALETAIKSNRLAEKVLMITQAKTPEAREKAILTTVASLGDTLAAAVATSKQIGGTVSSGKDDESVTTEADESQKSRELPGPWGDHAEFSDVLSESIRGAFIAGANISGAVKALKAKPEPDYAAFAVALTAGMAHIGTAAATGKGQDSLYSREDLLSDAEVGDLSKLTTEELLQRRIELSGSSFNRTEDEEALAPFGHAGYLVDINSSMRSMVEAMQEMEKSPEYSAAVKANTQAALDKLEAEKTKDALEELKKKLLDPKEKEAFFKELEEGADEEVKRLEAVIEAASPPDDPNDKEAVKKSLAAVDALIADIKASEMKYKLIETIAKGGTKILTRIFPVTGLADAIRQLTFDAIALGRKAVEVGKWRKNAAMAASSSSIYAEAIEERLYNAKVQISQKTLNTFFSVLGVAAEGARLGDATGAATGISAATSLGKALSDFGYKMHDRARIRNGWKKYLEARANPCNRKAALAAIGGNSTLAKCVLAYGIVEDQDPIARQVGRNCGLTPEVLASDSDVCAAVVKYFETMFSEDPVVLRRVPSTENWHPGVPDLTLKSWLKFKQAAATRAYPRLAKDSCLTPDIDAALKELHKLCGGDPFNYPAVRDGTIAADPDGQKQFSQDVEAQLKKLSAALQAYKPKTSEPDNPDDQKWQAGMTHHEMEAVIDALQAQAALILRDVKLDV